MTDSIEEYEARRRLRRSRGRWRIIGVLALLVAAAAVFSQMKPPRGPHVARFVVGDVIFDDPARDKLLRGIAENDTAKALLLYINSPGGSVAGSEALYESLREIAAKKPVVATMGEVAASGGYIAALGADRVFARQTSLTGSVGVIFQVPNVEGLMEKVGVTVREYKSGVLKAEPDLYSATPPEAEAEQERLIADTFAWFLDLVRERRGIDEESLASIGKGGVFTGRMAQEMGLIDAIGDQDDARAWLSEEHDIAESLKILTYEIPADEEPFFGLLSGLLPSLPNLQALGARREGGLPMAILR